MGIPKIQTKRKSKIKGRAEFSKRDDRAVVSFDKMDTELTFPFDDEFILFDWESTPEGRVHAEVSSDKQTLLSVRPLSGTYYVKLKEFYAPEGQLPSPQHHEIPVEGGKRIWKFDAWIALLEVQKGDWAGTIFPSQIHYRFEDSGDGETAGINMGSNKADELVQFLEAAGINFDTDTIPLSENILPWLENTLKEHNKTFLMVVENGYANAYAPAPSGV